MTSMSTPWGPSHSVRRIAPGIVSFTTATHGGIQLSEERIAALPDAIRKAQGSDLEWFEEDCAASLVVLAFPEAFTDVAVWSAVNFIRAYPGYPAATAYIATEAAKPILDRHARFEVENGDRYVAGIQASSSIGWNVQYRRVRDGAEAFARGLSAEEAFHREPVDLTAFGDRVTYAPT
jgi:hypothetical protein